MKTLFLAVGLLAATPAFAEGIEGEGHAQINAGVERAEGESEGIVGFAAGYDFDLGKTLFVGAEIGIDKVLAEDTKVTLATVVRAGAKLSEADKLYGLGGVSTGGNEETQAVYGAGLEHSFGKFLADIEYRHLDKTSAEQFAVGVGILF